MGDIVDVAGVYALGQYPRSGKFETRERRFSTPGQAWLPEGNSLWPDFQLLTGSWLVRWHGKEGRK